MSNPRIIATVMMKGGSRKTTTTVLTAFGLAQLGEQVLIIDADAGTQGVTDWVTQIYAPPAGSGRSPDQPPVDVMQWAPRSGLLVPFVQEAAERLRADRVIIDVGGEAPEVVRQAVHIAELVLSPCGPEQGELGRLDATRTLVKANPAADHQVLLTRVPTPRRGVARDVRLALEQDGYQVHPVEIPHNRGLYAHVWGSVPMDAGRLSIGCYEALSERIHFDRPAGSCVTKHRCGVER